MKDIQLYQSEYSHTSFWQKIKKGAHKAGHDVIYNALVLFHTARADATPTWVKTVILGTLGYFISVIDGIPDLTPVLGYSDDLGLMVAAISALTAYITPEIRSKAEVQAGKVTGLNNSASEEEARPAQSPEQL